MRGGPGAQTPGNGGMKKHNPVTVELRNLQSLLQCGTRRRRAAGPGAPGMKIFENSPAGRSNSSTDEFFELTHVCQLKKFVHTRTSEFDLPVKRS
jgi:hypothetical protein